MSQPRPASSPDPAAPLPLPQEPGQESTPGGTSAQNPADRGAREKSKASLPRTKSVEVREVAYQPLSETWEGT